VFICICKRNVANCPYCQYRPEVASDE
jgi:hypothetical protein